MANRFEDAANDVLEGPTSVAAPPESPRGRFSDAADEVFAAEDTKRNISLEAAGETTPQERAKVISLSKKTGLNTAMIDMARPEAEARVRQEEARKAVMDAPVIKRLLQDPDFAALTHGDLPALAQVEKSTRTVLEHSQTILNSGLARKNGDGTGSTFLGRVENWEELNNGQPTLVPTFIGGVEYDPNTFEGKKAIIDYVQNSGKDWPTSANPDPAAAIKEVLAIERATHPEMEKQPDPYAGMGPVAALQMRRSLQFDAMAKDWRRSIGVGADTFWLGVKKNIPGLAQIGIDIAQQQSKTIGKPLGLGDD